MKEEILNFKGSGRWRETPKYSEMRVFLKSGLNWCYIPRFGRCKNLVKWVSKIKINMQIRRKIRLEEPFYHSSMRGHRYVWWSHWESLVLDFTRHMNKLIDHSLGTLLQKGGDDFSPSLVRRGGGSDYSITVQPGMFYRDFEK